MPLIRSFSQVDIYSLQEGLKKQIAAAIQAESKDFILNVDEEEYKQSIVDAYTFFPLEIDFNSEAISEPIMILNRLQDRYTQKWYDEDVYQFKVTYKFTGSSGVFNIRPSSHVLRSAEIDINDAAQTVGLTIRIDQPDAEKFNRLKEEEKRNAFVNLDSANKDALQWNAVVGSVFDAHFKPLKAKFIKENDFFLR